MKRRREGVDHHVEAARVEHLAPVVVHLTPELFFRLLTAHVQLVGDRDHDKLLLHRLHARHAAHVDVVAGAPLAHHTNADPVVAHRAEHKCRAGQLSSAEEHGLRAAG
eukprot:COSAG03_NODE_341_length_8828_cov_77.724940_9_plen_108_part_00